MNINECLTQITELTRENLKILHALDDSLHTNKNHILANVNGENFAIPSFMSLENRINLIEENLNNVLNAPKTGEAFTYFDGMTQKLELGGYATTPAHVDLDVPKVGFGHHPNYIFKDFMNPNPFVRLDISSIPNNVKHVNVKKIVLKNPELIKLVDESTGIDTDACAKISYADIHKLLFNRVPEEDYVEYDTIRRLPLRNGGAYGIYNISEILDEYQDENFEEHYTLKLDRDLVYHINNGTIQRNVQVGDHMVTRDDKIQLLIEDIKPTARTIKVKVELGGYADLTDSTSNNPDLYTLKFYQPVDFESNKYIEVPLEEDPNIIIFVATINDTTNAQAPWGGGLYYNTYKLSIPDPKDPTKMLSFETYYRDNVNNVGDALNAITHMMDDDSQIEKLNSQEFKALQDYHPVIEGSKITVTQINKHLNDTKNVKAIRNLYNQKNQYKVELDDVQRSIDNVNKELAQISFDDTTNTRTVYENKLSEYNAKKKDLTSSISSIITEINTNANSSDIPIENAKYHIRGFIDVEKVETLKAKVIKLDVEYRYKNKNKFIGNAETIGDGYIYSDWNKMTSPYRTMKPEYVNGYYKYTLQAPNEKENEISFNQIDIPISQGETVDIRVRYIYNLGHPFVEMTSSWSQIFNQAFPQEFLKNVEILDIIEENNNDAKKQQFTGLMEQKGIINHVDDSIQDQTIKYFHKPEHIASGFYTAERRIIPLLDKLKDMDSTLVGLMSEVYGVISDSLELTLSDANNSMLIKPNIVNTFRTLSYSTNETKIKNEVSGDKEFAFSQLTLALRNKGEFPIKLYSIFPGDYNTELNSQTALSKYDVNDYIVQDLRTGHEGSIWMQYDEAEDGKNIIPQRLNQFMYFRSRVDGATPIYDLLAKDIVHNDEIQKFVKLAKNPNLASPDIAFEYRSTTSPLTSDNEQGIGRAGYLLPYPGTINKICIGTDKDFVVLEPGESIVLPISYYYWIEEQQLIPKMRVAVTRSLMFDIRTSLFSDPVTYKLNVTANLIDTQNFKAVSATKLDSLPAYSMTTMNNTSTKKRTILKRPSFLTKK